MSRHHRSGRLVAAGAASLLLAVTGGVTAAAQGGPAVIASGLNSPRQLAFTPGGDIKRPVKAMLSGEVTAHKGWLCKVLQIGRLWGKPVLNLYLSTGVNTRGE